MKAIVYESNTGTTKEYAKMLSKKLHLPNYSIKEAKKKLNRQDDIIFLGWVRVSIIQGYKKAKKRYHIINTIAVGAYKESKANTHTLQVLNKVDEPLFYLRGGLHYEKLNKIYQILLKAISNEIAKDDKELLLLFRQGGSFVEEQNIDKLLKRLE